RRQYLDDTNVLVTEFRCAGGALEVTDCMPVAPLDPSEPTKVRACHSILRRLRCSGGAVNARVTIAPRFEYGLFTPRFLLTSERTTHRASPPKADIQADGREGAARALGPHGRTVVRRGARGGPGRCGVPWQPRPARIRNR